MLAVYPAMTGWLAEWSDDGYAQVYECWSECPLRAALKAIQAALR